MILFSTSDVPSVPSEQRWSLPRREHVSCAEDPSGASNTFAMSYLGSDFVFKIFSQSSQIFPHERNWVKMTKAQKLYIAYLITK